MTGSKMTSWGDIILRFVRSGQYIMAGCLNIRNPGGETAVSVIYASGQNTWKLIIERWHKYYYMLLRMEAMSPPSVKWESFAPGESLRRYTLDILPFRFEIGDADK